MLLLALNHFVALQNMPASSLVHLVDGVFLVTANRFSFAFFFVYYKLFKMKNYTKMWGKKELTWTHSYSFTEHSIQITNINPNRYNIRIELCKQIKSFRFHSDTILSRLWMRKRMGILEMNHVSSFIYHKADLSRISANNWGENGPHVNFRLYYLKCLRIIIIYLGVDCTGVMMWVLRNICIQWIWHLENVSHSKNCLEIPVKPVHSDGVTFFAPKSTETVTHAKNETIASEHRP